MKIIDAHLHLYPKPILKKEFEISKEPINEYLITLSKKISEYRISKGLIYLIDSRVKFEYIELPTNLLLSGTVNVKNPDLESVLNNNIKLIKIYPYDHKLSKLDYSNVLNIAYIAQENNIALTICSTYGSKLLYDINGVELAAYIKKYIDVPIILAHGGGPKIFDAMTMAIEYDNIFLDLSFSLKYWYGSSVIQDYAFALKKLDCERIFYGSDYPYVDFKDSLWYFLNFIEKYNFTNKERDLILYKNFELFEETYLK